MGVFFWPQFPGSGAIHLHTELDTTVHLNTSSCWIIFWSKECREPLSFLLVILPNKVTGKPNKIEPQQFPTLMGEEIFFFYFMLQLIVQFYLFKSNVYCTGVCLAVNSSAAISCLSFTPAFNQYLMPLCFLYLGPYAPSPFNLGRAQKYQYIHYIYRQVLVYCLIDNFFFFFLSCQQLCLTMHLTGKGEGISFYLREYLKGRSYNHRYSEHQNENTPQSKSDTNDLMLPPL